MCPEGCVASTSPLQVPLMRHPSGAPEVCVNCSHNLAAGANGTAGAGSPAQQQGNATAAAALANGGVETESEDDEAEQQAGGDLGAGILQPPLSLSSRLRADLGSAAWGDARPEEAGNAAEEPASQLSSSRDAIRTGGAARQAQRAERAQQAAQGQEASATIAGMMLQGWAMLEQHCPRWVAGGRFRPASGAWQPALPRCCPCGWRRQHASLPGWRWRRPATFACDAGAHASGAVLLLSPLPAGASTRCCARGTAPAPTVPAAAWTSCSTASGRSLPPPRQLRSTGGSRRQTRARRPNSPLSQPAAAPFLPWRGLPAWFPRCRLPHQRFKTFRGDLACRSTCQTWKERQQWWPRAWERQRLIWRWRSPAAGHSS
jgi:hypothetical protein